MRIFAFALGLLLLSTPAFAMGSKRSNSQVAIEVMKPVTLEPVEVHTTKPVYLAIEKCPSCSVGELDFIRSATEKVNEVVAGTCFREKLMAMPLIQTEGRSPKQVVDSLIGVEIDIEMYWTVKRVLGYTLPSVPKVWLNRRYMTKWNVCDTASLLAHEASHKVGYGHDFKATARRPQSVPYSVNRAFGACCSK